MISDLCSGSGRIKIIIIKEKETAAEPNIQNVEGIETFLLQRHLSLAICGEGENFTLRPINPLREVRLSNPAY